MAEPGNPADDRDVQRAYVRRWQETARIVDELRNARLREVDTALAIRALAGAYTAARLRAPARTESGLVEQQRWFQRAHPHARPD